MAHDPKELPLQAGDAVHDAVELGERDRAEFGIFERNDRRVMTARRDRVHADDFAAHLKTDHLDLSVSGDHEAFEKADADGKQCMQRVAALPQNLAALHPPAASDTVVQLVYLRRRSSRRAGKACATDICRNLARSDSRRGVAGAVAPGPGSSV